MPGPYPGHLFHVEKGTPAALAFPFFSGVAQGPPTAAGCSQQGPLQLGATGGRPRPGQTCLSVAEAACPPCFTEALPGACDPFITLSVV